MEESRPLDRLVYCFLFNARIYVDPSLDLESHPDASNYDRKVLRGQFE